jgi:cyclopropane-fatty-acyl-phospholipid synthase
MKQSSQQMREAGGSRRPGRPEGRTPAPERVTPSTPFPSPEAGTGPALARTRGILLDLFGPVETRPFAVRFWTGAEDRPPEDPEFVLVLNHAGALRKALFPPTQAAMGAAYARGHIDIEGDIEAAATLAGLVGERLRSPAFLASLLARAARLPKTPDHEGIGPFSSGTPKGSRHSRARDAQAVRGHYDVGNDFYRLFLDRRMVYSCGYFADGDGTDDLDRAQEAKLEHVCRKLRLQPGEKLLDIGCGWGALILHAAERYGVEALGITLSERQAELARERIAAAGLSDHCRAEVRDYRDLPDDAVFDKISSIGMVEHVGRRRMQTYFQAAERHLKPGGLFLNHGIVSLDGPPGPLGRLKILALRPFVSFIQRYVFPDSELVSVAEVTAPGERVGLEVRDVESLREHYARTLRHWVRRLEDHEDEARRLVGDATYRVWRVYMAGCTHFFLSGAMGVVQTLWGKPAEDGSVPLPATRADLYAG